MESLFSWIAVEDTSSTSPSPHLPPPDFLSIVRRSRRGQDRQTTPPGVQSLTPLELRLRDLVLNLYSDQDSGTTLGRLSESEELSEIDSGHFSDRPTTSRRSPSPVGTMTEKPLTTPLHSYDNTIPAPVEQTAVSPDYFSADDLTHVSQDPQLPSLSQTGHSQFQFGVHGTEPGHSRGRPSSSSARPPYTTSPPSSLPLYSHTELNFAPQATQTSSSDLRSLVSRSFQLPSQHLLQKTQQQKTDITTPSSVLTTPTKSLVTPTKLPATPPASLMSLPHMQQTMTSSTDNTSTEDGAHSEIAVSSSDAEETTNQPDQLMHRDGMDLSQIQLQHKDSLQSDVVSAQQEVVSSHSDATSSQPDVLSTQPDVMSVVPAQQDVMSSQQDVTSSQRDVILSQQKVVLSQSDVTSSQRDIMSQQEVVSAQQEVVSAQQDGLSSNQISNHTLAYTSSRPGLEEGVLPRNPSDEHLQPGTPLSPKDIRDRLADVTQQSRGHGGFISSLTVSSERTGLNTGTRDELLSSSTSADEDKWEQKEEGDGFKLHHEEMSHVQPLSEQPHRGSLKPSPLPTLSTKSLPFSDCDKTPSRGDDIPDTAPLSSSPVTALLPSKYSKTTPSASSPIRMPQHLKPTHKPPSPHSSLPLADIPSSPLQNASLLMSQPHHLQPEQSNSLERQAASSSDQELTEALHSKAHLEGQLESVLEECRELLKERAALNSRLAVLEAELELARKEVRGPARDPTVKADPPETTRLRQELQLSQSELIQVRKALDEARGDASRGRLSSQQLQAEVEDLKKKLETRETHVGELTQQLREATSKQEEEKSTREEIQHQFHSLQGSYRALEESKSWMQQQLQEAVETKIAVQEELRTVKASSIANTVKVDQLTRENASFLQQISNLQKGIFQDKAKLVDELEAIEADILSKEDSFAQLVAEKSQLEELAQQRATEIERLSTAVGQALVERDDMRTREQERVERVGSLEEQCQSLQRATSDLKTRLREAEADLIEREQTIEQLQKLKTDFHERLRHSEAALVSREGTIQGLQDAREILRQELEMVRLSQQRVERELEEERRRVVQLEASLVTTKDGSEDEEDVIKTLTEIQQLLESENRELRGALMVRETEAGRKERETASLQAQCQDAVEKIQDLTTRLHSTASECDTVREGIRERDSTIARLSQESSANRQELADTRSDRDSLQSRLNTTLQQKSRLEGQLAEQSSLSELEHLQAAVAERGALQKQLESMKLTHQQDLRQAQTRLGQMEAEVASAKREIERTQKQAQRAIEEKEKIAGKMAEMKSRTKLDLDEMKRALEEAQLERQRAEREAVSLRTELKDMQAHSQRLQREANIVREKLVYESAQRGEVERASSMVTLKLRQSAEERGRELQERNQSLSVELERLRGRLEGHQVTQQAMRSHTSQLETALAEREATLTKINTEIQRLMSEKQRAETQVHVETSSLREEAAALRLQLSETQELLRSEQERGNELSEELVRTTHDLSRVRAEQTAEDKNLSSLEEKITRRTTERDELHLDLTTVRAQLVIAKTAAESSARELTDRQTQVEILQRKLSALDRQCRESEGEVEKLRGQLRRGESESTMVEGGRRRFDSSLSTIAGDENTDSLLPATHESSTSMSSYGDPNSPPTHLTLHTQHLREMGERIERARRQGQEAAEAKSVGEISVLRDQLGSKSRTINTLQSCLVSLKGDMSKLQHKMESHSATVRASHHTTKQLETQLADLKRSSGLQSPSFLGDL